MQYKKYVQNNDDIQSRIYGIERLKSTLKGGCSVVKCSNNPEHIQMNHRIVPNQDSIVLLCDKHLQDFA